MIRRNFLEAISSIWSFFQNQILKMEWLNHFIQQILTGVGLNIDNHIGGNLQFFIYDVIKITILLCVLIFGRDNVFIKIELEKPNNDDAVQEEDDSKVLKIVGKDLAKALNREKPLSRGEIKKIIEVLDEYGL